MPHRRETHGQCGEQNRNDELLHSYPLLDSSVPPAGTVLGPAHPFKHFGSTLNRVRSPSSDARFCRARTPQRSRRVEPPPPASRALRARGAARALSPRHGRRHRRRTPTGRTTNEPDRAASDRSSSVLRTFADRATVRSGPKQPPSTTAWRSRTLNVDARAMPSQRAASSRAHTMSDAPASARRTSHPSRARPTWRSMPPRPPRSTPGRRASRQPRLPQGRVVRQVDRPRGRTPRRTRAYRERAGRRARPAADADLPEDTDEVVDPDRGAGPVLGDAARD